MILPKRGSIGLRPQGSRPGDSPCWGGGVGAAIRVGFGRPGIASGLNVEPPECPWPRSTTRRRRSPDESATNYLSEVPRLAWFHRGYARATTASAISSSERPVAAARASMISTASSIEQSACTAIISDAWSTLLDICCVVIRTLLPYLEGPDARRLDYRGGSFPTDCAVKPRLAFLRDFDSTRTNATALVTEGAVLRLHGSGCRDLNPGPQRPERCAYGRW